MKADQYFFIKLQLWLDQSLSHRYDPRVSQKKIVDFSVLNARKITDRSGRYHLIANGILKAEPIQKTIYRLPQTRFWLSVFRARSFTVRWLEYFNYQLVLIKNYHSSPLQFQWSSQSGEPFTTTGKWNGKAYFSVESYHAFWNFPAGKQEILATLHRWRDREYRIHPLHHLEYPDFDYLSALDKLWVALPGIEPQGDISVQQVLSQKPAFFFLLQELFLSFGKIEPLKIFYRRLVEEHWKNLPRTRQELFYYGLLRCKGSGVNVALPKDLKFRPVQKPQDFFKRYVLRPLPQADPDLSEKMQSTWEKYSLPLFSNVFRDRLNNRPEEWAAFYLLAKNAGFVWADWLAEKIRQELEDTHLQTIFQLIRLVKNNVVFARMDQDRFFMTSGGGEGNIHGLRTGAPEITFSQIRRKKKVYCRFNQEQLFEFEIDQAVRLEFDLKQKRLTIRPYEVLPPLPPLDYQRVEVSVSGFRLEIPLIWRQFFISFNGVRLRFLLKKKKFQISVRRPKSLPQIRINGRELPQESGRYIKTYLDVERQSGQWQIQLCDILGRRKKFFSKNEHEYYILGGAKDINGIFRREFRAYHGKSKKNFSVCTGPLNLSPITLTQPGQKLRLTARKCPPYEQPLSESSGVWRRLLLSSPQELQQKLKIITRLDALEIRDKFYQEWGFYPDVVSKEEVGEKEGFFYFYVGEEPAADDQTPGHPHRFIVSELPDFKGFPAIRISRKQLDYFLKNIWMFA